MEYKYDEMKQSPCTKKNIKILLLISTVSLLIISFYPNLLPLLIQFFDHYTTAFSISSYLFRYSSERNYIFLFCNGILFLVIKTSILKDNSFLSSQSIIQEDSRNNHKKLSMSKPGLLAKRSIPDAKDVPVDYEEEVHIYDEKEEKTNRIGLLAKRSIPAANNVPMDYEEVNIHDEEEEKANEIGLLSAEELNRKCDDFIRKMKEGIKVEVRPATNKYRVV